MKDNRQLIREIAQEAHALGGRALLVGGCVRDELTGVPCYDIDCEIHGVEKQALREMLSRFGRIDESGEAYGIFTLEGCGLDIALPRLETRTGQGHRDFTVTVDPFLSPERAAARRDFTVNAIMRDALTGEMIDPYGGVQDLENGVLRAVPGGQFEEDPLRVLRGAQFAARFHLAPDEKTMESMRRMPLDSLSAPRVAAEMKKALLISDQPDVFFRVLLEADALHAWFPELEALTRAPQNPVYHPEGDSFEHTMLVLREAAAFRDCADDPLAFMLAALVHDLGKAVSTKKNDKGAWQAIGHEHTGLHLIETMLARLGFSKAVIAYAKDMCRLHMRVHTCYYQKARVSRTNVLFDESCCPQELMNLVVCDARGTGKPREQADAEEAFIGERLEAYRLAASRPMPTAKMLLAAGAAPGPQLGAALKKARELVLSGEEIDRAVRNSIRI